MRITSSLHLVALLALAVPSFSQLTSELGSLSTSCQAAATGLVTDAFGTCVDVLGLVSVLSASGSIISPLNSWLEGACTQTCSNSTLSTANTAITSGCASDIANSSTIAVALETLTAQYPDVKDVICLQAVSNSTYCLTTLLTAVQTASGTTLNVSSITTLLTGGTTAFESLLSSLPASSLCTDCTHAMISKVGVLATATSTSDTAAFSAVSAECGASYVDGTIPSTVQEATSSNSSSASSTGSVSSTSLSAAGRTIGDGGMLFAVVGVVGALAGGVWTLV